MKKLIAIAAVALVGAAFADCNTCNTCTKPCGWGYKVKILLKTTAAKDIKKVNTCNTCSTCSTGCYRKPTTKRYLGYFFGQTAGEGTTCSPCGCNAWKTFNFVLWNYDTKQAILVPTFAMMQFNRFGEEKGTAFEMAFSLWNRQPLQEYSLGFAGFGNVGKRTDGTIAIKSVSGFCAGVINSYCSTYEKACEVKLTGISRTYVWTICGTKAWSQTTAAYGKWVMAWDSSIVNRITAGKIGFTGHRATSGFVPARFQNAGYKLLFAVDQNLINEDEEEEETVLDINGHLVSPEELEVEGEYGYINEAALYSDPS